MSGAAEEGLRRLGGILSSPSLVLSYGHTTPARERAWLRRAGLSRAEADALLEKLCRHGLMDTGARALVVRLCAERGLAPDAAARLLLAADELPESSDHRKIIEE